jgi:carnitine O-acetyltransferase
MFFNRASRAAEQQLRDREAWRHDDAVRARSDAILAAFDARAALFSGPLGLRREARWDFGAWPAGLEWARRASEAVRALVEDSDLCHSVWPGLGAPRMKACGMSPDTFCQLAIQAAHAAVAPALGAEATVCVYETVGLAGYLHGRTETCRAVTSESAAFARALVAWRAAGRPLDGPLRAQARDSARAAAKRHVRTLRRCLQGAGVDRHLLALRLVAMEERSAAAASTDRASTDRAAEMPRVFSQPIFARSGGTACWRISTSNNSYIDHLGGSGAFGAVVPDGYGCVYHYCEEFCAFVCECKRSCGRTTSAAGLSAAVKEAMTDMVRVLAPAERGRL